MPAQWTGKIVGEIHNHRLTLKELAQEVGWNDKYLSQVINSDNPPKTAERKLTDALNRLITNRSSQIE
jgi:YesN/AraC family two-component response regulator